MRFVCWITAARIQTHTHNISYFLRHSWLIPFDFVNWEETQRIICHCSLFSQTVHLKKAMSSRIFFCFSAASGNLHEVLHMCYCWLRQQFALQALSCNTQHFYMAGSDVSLNGTHKMPCGFLTVITVTWARRSVTLCICCLPSLGLYAVISRSVSVKLYLQFE